MTLIICKRTDCKWNKENNPFQRVSVCQKGQIILSERGFCKTHEKRREVKS